MSEELPKGWVKTTLGEIVEPSRERALPAEFPAMRYVGLEHIEPQTMRLLGHGDARDARSSSMRFSKGDVLYGKMRPYLNKVWVAEFDGLCSAEFLVFPKLDGLNSQFLAIRLNAEDFVTFANGQVSGERPRVDFQKLAPFSILLPPAVEQERIVAKLDAALTRMANAEKAAQSALQRLEGHRASVLHAAVTGELTRAWRKAHLKNKKAKPETGEVLLQCLLAARRARWEETELKRLSVSGKAPKDDKWKSRYPEPTPPKPIDLHELPSGWCWASIEQLLRGVDGMAYGVLKPGPLVENGVPMLRVMDIMQDGHIAKENVYRISANLAEEFKRTRLEAGDVLLSVMGTVGRTAVVPESMTGGNVNRAIAVLKLIDPRFAEFLHMVLMSPLLQGRFSSEKLGTAQQRINLADLRRFAIPLPPANEQNEIIREVDRRLAAADRLACTLDQQLERARATAPVPAARSIHWRSRTSRPTRRTRFSLAQTHPHCTRN
jgi:type I restriction enzyme S subunit